MNKEIDFKKFLIGLFIYLFFLFGVLVIVFSKIKPFSKVNNPCVSAICEFCVYKDNKKQCSGCSLFNEKEERVWVGTCNFLE